MSSASKKRKYCDDYIKFGFNVINKNGTDQPQCVICYDVLSNDALRPTRLMRHLETNHGALKDKPEEYFVMKSRELKRIQTNTAATFVPSTSKIVEASYEISLLIAKNQKPHTIGETLVKPCLLKAAEVVLGPQEKKKLTNISLSDNTVKRRIDDMGADIRDQVVEGIKSSPWFAVQCDESTDVANCCQLLVFARYIYEDNIKEELLFVKDLKTTAKASDVMAAFTNFFDTYKILWIKLIGVCTDGAPSMIGCRSGFVTLLKEKNPAILSTHCMIHRQALAAKTLPDEMNSVLKLAIKVVNYIKHSAVNTRLFAALCDDLSAAHKTLLFHTEVRWLSKGNMLARLFMLKDEVLLFLEQQHKTELHDSFSKDAFQLSLAYLADFFESLNSLNLKLQGNMKSNIMAHHDFIKAFVEKLQLWKRRVQAQNYSAFPKFSSMLEDKQETGSQEAVHIMSHLESVAAEFGRYFPENFSDDPIHKLIRNPFVTDVEQLPEILQEEALDVKNDSSARDNFSHMDLTEFWIKYYAIYPIVGKEALRLLLPFSTTYLCERGFSTLLGIKTKQRNRLHVENDLRCALTTVPPRIHQLVNKVQPQCSH